MSRLLLVLNSNGILRYEQRVVKSSARKAGVPVNRGHRNLNEASVSTLYPASFRGPLAVKQPNQVRISTQAKGTLIVGEGVRVTGTLDGCDTLIVQGLVRSSFKAQSLLVLEGGVCAGTVETENADIAGIFDGELAVQDRLKVRSKGRLRGTFHYARISIEEGAEISGNMEVGGNLPPPLQWQKSKPGSPEYNEPVESAEPPESEPSFCSGGQIESLPIESLPINRGSKLRTAGLLQNIRPDSRGKPNPPDSTRGET